MFQESFTQLLISCENYNKIQIFEPNTEYVLQCLLENIKHRIRLGREESDNHEESDEPEESDNPDEPSNEEKQEYSIEEEIKSQTEGIQLHNHYYYPITYVNGNSKPVYHMMLQIQYTLSNRQGDIYTGIIDDMLPSYSKMGQRFMNEIIETLNHLE